MKLGVPASWFDRDGRKVTKSIEGFLFPDTYEFPPDVTAQAALEMMVQRFLAGDRRAEVRRHGARRAEGRPRTRC